MFAKSTLIVAAAAAVSFGSLASAATDFYGNIDNDWAKSGNWSSGVPTASDEAIIYQNRTPVISADSAALKVKFKENTSLTINSGTSSLGDVFMDGASTGTRTLNVNGGNVTFGTFNISDSNQPFTFNFNGGVTTFAGSNGDKIASFNINLANADLNTVGSGKTLKIGGVSTTTIGVAPTMNTMNFSDYTNFTFAPTITGTAAGWAANDVRTLLSIDGNTIDGSIWGSNPTGTFDGGNVAYELFRDNSNHNLNIRITSVVPEPTSLAGIGLGAIGLLSRRRRV